MTTWGYARVSTVDQNPAAQLDALRGAGVDEEHLVVDHASGAKASRPGLDRLMAALSRGDVLLVWKLDRLGRSLAHLVGLIGQLGDKGVQFRCVTQSSIDTTTPQGRMVFAITAAMAEFERDLIRERTAAGLAVARASGKRVGRGSDTKGPNSNLWWSVRVWWRRRPIEVRRRMLVAGCGCPPSTWGRHQCWLPGPAHRGTGGARGVACPQSCRPGGRAHFLVGVARVARHRMRREGRLGGRSRAACAYRHGRDIQVRAAGERVDVWVPLSTCGRGRPGAAGAVHRWTGGCVGGL